MYNLNYNAVTEHSLYLILIPQIYLHSVQLIQISRQKALENARRKPLEDAKQKVSGRTGFNISLRNEVEVRQDSLGYFPTINVPATNMSTVHFFFGPKTEINLSLTV